MRWIELCEAKRLMVGHIPVWMNPSAQEMRNLLRKSKHDELRGFLAGDLYVWDAGDAVHDAIEQRLGHEQGIFIQGAMKLNLYPTRVEISYRDDPDPDGDPQDDEAYVANHPQILRAYGQAPEVIASTF